MGLNGEGIPQSESNTERVHKVTVRLRTPAYEKCRRNAAKAKRSLSDFLKVAGEEWTPDKSRPKQSVETVSTNNPELIIELLKGLRADIQALALRANKPDAQGKLFAEEDPDREILYALCTEIREVINESRSRDQRS